MEVVASGRALNRASIALCKSSNQRWPKATAPAAGGCLGIAILQAHPRRDLDKTANPFA